MNSLHMKLQKALLLSFAILFASISLYGQRTETVFGRNGLGLTGIWGTFSNNYSYFEDDFIYVRGGYGALEFNKNFLLGYAGYSFRDRATIEDINRDFNLRYRGFYLGILPNSRKVIHPKFTMIIAGGRTELDNRDTDRVFVFQPSGGFEVNIFKWFRIGAEAGYRLVANNDFDQIENGDLSSPFVQLDFKFGIAWGGRW